MKTIILYYSHSGNTRAYANQMAAEKGADIEEIVEIKKPIMPIGIQRAVTFKRTPIRPIKANLDDYDRITIMSPVWAGHPVSAIYSAIDLLPEGKQVELIMVSAGGGSVSSAKKVVALVHGRKCDVAWHEDVSVKVNKKTGEVNVEVIDTPSPFDDEDSPAKKPNIAPIVIIGLVVIGVCVYKSRKSKTSLVSTK